MKQGILFLICVAALSGRVFCETPAPISQVTNDKMGKAVTVAGEVVSFQESRKETAPYSFRLQDASGQVRVAIWPDVFNQIADKDKIKHGAKVTIHGEGALFHNAVEIHVTNAADVIVNDGKAEAPSAASAAPATAIAPAAKQTSATSTLAKGDVTGIGSITPVMVKQTVTISGKVTSARAPKTERAPYILKITDDTGSIDVVFWTDTAQKLTDAQKVNEGDKARITGQVNEFNKNLQIRVDDPAGIKTPKSHPDLFPSDKSTSASAQNMGKTSRLAILPIAEVAGVAIKDRVAISGRVETVEPLRAGKRLTVKDPTGMATVLLWDTATGLTTAADTLRPNDVITLAGSVEEALSTRVITVIRPGDVYSVVR
ncbi:MAG: exodeoxyribonuclease VII large subunit [Candidatus Sumerlaeota bacterium]|nr:exodeoxyribonuclease VII large subunit [Candidatus Sumerlaeota bacterium]